MKRLIILFSVFILTAGISYSADITQKITYSNKGSKSEARHGYLLYKGKSIPDFFNKLITGSTVYVFYQRKNMWGDDGYFQLKEDVKIVLSKEKISKADLQTGWYLGKEKLAGTPLNWIYVEWEDKSAFLSLDKLQEFSKNFEMESIERALLDDMRG